MTKLKQNFLLAFSKLQKDHNTGAEKILIKECLVKVPNQEHKKVLYQKFYQES